MKPWWKRTSGARLGWLVIVMAVFGFAAWLIAHLFVEEYISDHDISAAERAIKRADAVMRAGSP